MGQSDTGDGGRSLLSEPLLHFVVLGALIFAVQQAFGADDEGAEAGTRTPIVVTEELRASLAADRYRRTGERPTGEDLDALVAQWVRDEALYREAVRLGLDRGDTIVRRRLVQKMEFLLSSAADVPEPSDAQLEAFLAERPADFTAPAEVAFTHVFLSRDARGDTLADDGAALMEALSGAGPEGASGRGDPFILGARVGLSTEEELAGRFGIDFAAAAIGAAEGTWVGPIESSFGLHAIFITERDASRRLEVDDARPALSAAFMEEERSRAASAAATDVVQTYSVERLDE